MLSTPKPTFAQQRASDGPGIGSCNLITNGYFNAFISNALGPIITTRTPVFLDNRQGIQVFPGPFCNNNSSAAFAPNYYFITQDALPNNFTVNNNPNFHQEIFFIENNPFGQINDKVFKCFETQASLTNICDNGTEDDQILAQVPAYGGIIAFKQDNPSSGLNLTNNKSYLGGRVQHTCGNQQPDPNIFLQDSNGSTMQPPGRYKFSVDIALADNSRFASGRLGLYLYSFDDASGFEAGCSTRSFTEINGTLHQNSPSEIIPIIPNILINEVITSTEWVSYEFEFETVRGFNNFLFGVFDDIPLGSNSLGAPIMINPNGTVNAAFYFVDNLSLQWLDMETIAVDYPSLVSCEGRNMRFSVNGFAHKIEFYNADTNELLQSGINTDLSNNTASNYTLNFAASESFNLKIVTYNGFAANACLDSGTFGPGEINENSTFFCRREKILPITVLLDCCADTETVAGNTGNEFFIPHSSVQVLRVYTPLPEEPLQSDNILSYFSITMSLSLTPEFERKYIVNTDLLIEVPGVSFEGFEYMQFQTGKKIIIKEGASLTLRGYNRLMNKCDNYWGGIVVEPGGELIVETLEFTQEDGSVLELAAEIRNATVGIEILPGGKLTINNAPLTERFMDRGIRGLRIYNCPTGILAEGLTVAENPDPLITGYLTILRANSHPLFQNDPFFTGFLRPEINSTGINISNGEQVALGALNPVFSEYAIRISGYRAGIRIWNSNAQLENILIENSSYGIRADFCDNLNVKNSYFGNNRRGIRFLNVRPQAIVHLEENLITNINYPSYLDLPNNLFIDNYLEGIDLRGSTVRDLAHSVIHKNTILNYRDAIAVRLLNNIEISNNNIRVDIQNITSRYWGLWAQSSNSLTITNNFFEWNNPTFNGFSNLSVNLPFVNGAYLGGSSNSKINNNLFKETARGLHLVGVSPNTTFTCNTFEANKLPIHFLNATVGTQVGSQFRLGRTDCGHDNIFLGTVGTNQIFGSLGTTTTWHFSNSGNFSILPHQHVGQLQVSNASNSSCIVCPVELDPIPDPGFDPNLGFTEVDFIIFEDENKEHHDIFIATHGEQYRYTLSHQQKGLLTDLTQAVSTANTALFEELAFEAILFNTEIEQTKLAILELINQMQKEKRIELSAEETAFLQEIACLDEFFYGDGVISARVLLDDDYLDCSNKSNRSENKRTNRRLVPSPAKAIINNTAELSLYPNPVKNNQTLFILASIIDGATADYSIKDAQGKIVARGRVNPISKNMIALNVSSLAKGLYFVEVLNPEIQKRDSTKFIVE
ncbi:MAG: T9SS type A sorting domain-containing protein [Luteibaculaceae bacterium]